MTPFSRTLDTTRFLTHARIGDVIAPTHLQAQLQRMQPRPPIGNYVVQTSVPNWLIERLDPDLPMSTDHVLYPMLNQQDALLLGTLQVANLQLRYVFPLSDPMVRTYLSDALDHQRLWLSFDIEDTRQSAVMAMSFSLAAPEVLRRHVGEAKWSPAASRRAVGITTQACYPAFQPSLIDGQSVDDVFAVLVSTVTNEHLAASDSAQQTPPRSGRHLH